MDAEREKQGDGGACICPAAPQNQVEAALPFAPSLSPHCAQLRSISLDPFGSNLSCAVTLAVHGCSRSSWRRAFEVVRVTIAVLRSEC